MDIFLIYFGAGLVVFASVLMWRRDMRGIFLNEVDDLMFKNLGILYGWKRFHFVPQSMVIGLMNLFWPLILVAAIKRQVQGRANVYTPEGEVTEVPEEVKSKTDDEGVVTNQQVNDLRGQIKRLGASSVRGQLISNMRPKMAVFVREFKRDNGRPPTVAEVLVNADKSPEYMRLCEEIGFGRDRMVKICLEVGAVQ